MKTIICPLCGHNIVLDIGVETTRLNQDELSQLIPKSLRSDPPPNILVETLPDEGWLHKHINERRIRLERKIALILFAIAFVYLLIVIISILAR